ncbi:MAG: hypothetical protein GTN89_05300, partial [Acidobacteria bacterium]|nr:hypothetical protein [Acidobacteriota bacterium]
MHRDDLDPGLNPGARYFVEGQYVAADDAAAQRDNNNNSYREITIDPVTFDAAVIGTTVRQTPGISIWGDVQSGVRGASIDVVNDGR